MFQPGSTKALAGLVVVCALLAAACGPGTTKEEYLASGDGYVKERKYAEAIVQYRNAIALDPRYGEARYKLAQAYIATDDAPRALEQYVRAADLMPDNTDAQLRAAELLLLARRFEDAKARVETVLKREPKNVDALIAMAGVFAGLKDPKGSIAELEEAIEADPDNARPLIMLGAVQISQQDSARAEEALKKAVELEPKSIAVRHALAGFYWQFNRPAEAEAALRDAIALDPSDLRAQRVLAVFLIAHRRADEAEAPLKAVAESTKTPLARLSLADYYIGRRRLDTARPILEELSRADETYVQARVRLARIDQAGGRRDAAQRAIAEALARDAKSVDALVMQADMLLEDRKFDEALKNAQAAVAADPQAARAHTALGDVFAARLDNDTAIREYRESLRLNPRMLSTQLKLSRMQLLKGDNTAAVASAEDAVRLAPNSAGARLVRARAYMIKGEYGQAQADLDLLAKSLPSMSAVHAQLGDLYMARQNRPAARKAYDQALTLDPDSFDAIRGRVMLDLVEGNGAQARQLAERQLQKSPSSPRLLLLMATVHGALNDYASQEQALVKVIELDPNNLPAFGSLAAMYVKQGKLDQARARYAQLAERPATAVPALTMVGLIYEAQNQPGEAKKIYEKVLQANPEAAVAANNLAWRIAEDGGNLDVALGLAQTAKRKLPEVAEVSDTLGWIYYKKGMWPAAIEEFQASVQASPAAAEFRYHLGLAHAGAGNLQLAAQELDRAIKMRPGFKEAEAARRALPLK